MRLTATYRRQTRRARLCAWLLLLVYVPMVAMSLLHLHAEIEIVPTVDCAQCHSHVHHSGHLTVSHQHHDDCLFCRLLSVQLTFASQRPEIVDRPLLATIDVYRVEAVVAAEQSVVSLRAPPYVL